MSRRARSARRLATLLTQKSGTFVRISYDRDTRQYRVVWAKGPDVRQLRATATACADRVPDLDVYALRWERDQ
ncbi:hypothetical protein [Crossiella sp. CA198]|uniref:hypothetical protein n=1 Tax=Crossiella sp. CA198 TaxID=3455607 RepID=UPI003F8D70BB